jgi:general secretion pathway protein J
MVSIGILALVSGMVWSSMSQTATLKQKVEALQDRTSQVRMAMNRMAREIAMAYISDHEDPTIQAKRTMFDGHPKGSGHDLTFSYQGHMRLYKDAAESDTALVTYSLEFDPENRGRQNLVRRETRRLQPLEPQQIAADSYVLCEDVTRFKLTYYDRQKKDWQEQWSTINADGQQYLPWRVKIELTVRDERGVEQTFTTETRTMLTERIGWTPQ